MMVIRDGMMRAQFRCGALHLVVLALLCAPSAAAGPPEQESAYDVSALLVPLARAAELPALLTLHKSVRLGSWRAETTPPPAPTATPARI